MSSEIPKFHETFIPILDVLKSGKIINFNEMRKDREKENGRDRDRDRDRKGRDAEAKGRYIQMNTPIEEPRAEREKICRKMHKLAQRALERRTPATAIYYAEKLVSLERGKSPVLLSFSSSFPSSLSLSPSPSNQTDGRGLSKRSLRNMWPGRYRDLVEVVIVGFHPPITLQNLPFKMLRIASWVRSARQKRLDASLMHL